MAFRCFSISRDKEKQGLDSSYMGEQHLGGRTGAQVTFQMPIVRTYKLSQSVHKEQERFFNFSPSNAPLCVAIGDPTERNSLLQHHYLTVGLTRAFHRIL